PPYPGRARRRPRSDRHRSRPPVARARRKTPAATRLTQTVPKQYCLIRTGATPATPGRPTAMLRISRLADYGTQVMTQMASHPERLFSASDLASSLGLGQATVSKVLKSLARHDLVAGV